LRQGGTLLLCATLMGLLGGSTQRAVAQPEPSLCHAFVDLDFIWTLEIIRTRQATTPILNVVALASGEWEIQPGQLRLVDPEDQTIAVENFSFDSGDPSNPHLVPYLKLRGGDVAGLDLIGDFRDVRGLRRVEVELGPDRFVLEPLDCTDFEDLVDRIGQMEIGRGNVIAAYQVLNIQLKGQREVR
jgi:hypothetical protein